jgi:hypothetical protein
MRVEEKTASTAPAHERKRLKTETSTSLSGLTLAPPGKLMAAALIGAVLTVSPFEAVTDPRAWRRDDVVADSSTASADVDPAVVKEVTELFDQAATEFFHDGIQSRFSRGLLALIGQYGKRALRAISEYLFSGDAKPSATSEALRWIADYRDPSTFFERWAILQQMLKDRSAAVRDGAILGFATLDDPRARPLLTEARGDEAVNELRQLIDQVLAQLERIK